MKLQINVVLVVTGKWETGHLSENSWCRNASQRGHKINSLNWHVPLHYLNQNVSLPGVVLVNSIGISPLWIYQN